MDPQSACRDFDQALNAFLVSLAFAEKAAAEQCKIISEQFEEAKEPELAEKYRSFMQEEQEHFERVQAVCKNMDVPISDRAEEAYRGGFMTSVCGPLERMVAVHLAFEPSALAFLGYLANSIHSLTDDAPWANRIESAFREILREEISHVYSGRDLIRPLWEKASASEKKAILKTVRKQRAFLKAGLPSFFKAFNGSKEFLSDMLARFDFYFDKHSKDLIYETRTQVTT